MTMWVLPYAMVTEVLPSTHSGAGLGVLNFLGYAGSTVMTPVFGALIDSTGSYNLSNEIVIAIAVLWPLEVAVLLLPTGMISVFTGAVDDGWGGLLGWMWAACAITTIVLVFVTRAALKERYYSAVMAATGLLYLAILPAFGTDIVARAVLDG